MRASREGPGVLYVSYDGVLDPLGASQVVPYVTALAATTRFGLISFEKKARWSEERRREEMRARLADHGVSWTPLRYHARPRLPATMWDMAMGARAVAREAGRLRATLVHCRGEVAMTMARRARLAPRTRLLLDRRGFFADERVESGSWTAGGAVDRAVRAAERRNLARADGLVVLTQAALSVLKTRNGPLPPHRVIPTCVDTGVFRPRELGEECSYAAVYSGSLGTWYMVDEMVALGRCLADALRGRVLFLTPDAGQALRAGIDPGWADVQSARHEDVRLWLRRARSAFFLIRPTPAKRASCPTKLAESLAAGLPVVANRGIGDVDDLLERERVGVLVDGFDEAAYRDAARRLAELLAEPGYADRCRRVAEREFALERGVALYRSLYDEIAALS